jgi:VanZ family protein
MAGIWLLSSIPDEGRPETFGETLLQWATPELQNLLHIPLFGGLAAAWYWALQTNISNTRRILFLAFLIPTLYSFIDEWHQLHVPGRYGSLTDIALNQAGILLVLLILPRRMKGKQKSASENNSGS